MNINLTFFGIFLILNRTGNFFSKFQNFFKGDHTRKAMIDIIGGATLETFFFR
jgi:hypothetical protein